LVRDGSRLGPGSLRVGRFIGRLGVVALPALEIGLELDERVVRRHVAKLEAVGWLGRAPGMWGESSVVWLTARGLSGAGLGGLRPVKTPPRPTTVPYGVLVGWSAARVERRGRPWRSARELTLDPEQWAVRVRDERGASRDRFPDLAVWLRDSSPPVALIVHAGLRRADRQRAILKGWRKAVQAGQYASVRYDCTSESVAERIAYLAKQVRLTGPEFFATVQPTRDEIIAVATDDPELEEPSGDDPLTAVHTNEAVDVVQLQLLPTARVTSIETRELPTPPEPESAEAAAAREQRYRKIFRIPEPKRRRWQR
jgi:hypothetical protein